MQRSPARPSNRRRTLLLLILAVVVAAAVLLLTRRGGHPSAALGATPTAVASVRTPGVTVLPTTPPAHRKLHAYALLLLPYLDRATSAFDIAARQAAQAQTPVALGAACAGYQDRITLLQDEFEGVPHTGPWYSGVGALHRRVAGVFNLMLGSMTECQTVGETNDAGSAATTVRDLAQAASSMRGIDSDAHHDAGPL